MLSCKKNNHKQRRGRMYYYDYWCIIDCIKMYVLMLWSVYLPFPLYVSAYSYMCVHLQVLSVHTPVSETASCCPTLLLPWWTPFGLQQVHRCVFVWSCVQLQVLLLPISVCAFLHGDECAPVQVWAFVRMHVHAQHVHTVRVCVQHECQPEFYWAHVSSAIKLWERCGRRVWWLREMVGGRGPCPVLVSLSSSCFSLPLLSSFQPLLKFASWNAYAKHGLKYKITL